ncbi:MAG: type II secretion system F family protein [Rhodocyclales bacterium]|nr:type II secretion system F family protein [Rhodocyclales bacterium]
MDWGYYLVVVFGFTAVVLACGGACLIWNGYKGPQAQKLERRLRALSAGGRGMRQAALLKQRSLSALPAAERLLLRIPRIRAVDRLLQQAGSPLSVARFLLASLLWATGGFVALLPLRAPIPLALAAAAVAGMLPSVRLLVARRRRLRLLERQLPDALDLIGRALRAGHAFSAGLGMVATEAADPIAGEFRTTFDEINFGIPAPDALHNLAARLPWADLRYFVIAVVIQRETGGNLAELLDNLSALIRARFKLQGMVRVLSTEGRLSAWVLGCMPFVLAAAISLVNPRYVATLWTDPAGPPMLAVGLALLMLGIAWMWRIVRL